MLYGPDRREFNLMKEAQRFKVLITNLFQLQFLHGLFVWEPSLQYCV